MVVHSRFPSRCLFLFSQTTHFQSCHRSGSDQGEKFFKVRKFYFESGEINILSKSEGKLKEFNTTGLIPWPYVPHDTKKIGEVIGLIPFKAGRSIWGHCDLNNTFL